MLEEAGHAVGDKSLAAIDARGAEAQADWSSLGSPETYLGYERGSKFASPGGVRANKPNVYVLPAQLKLNQWALAGDWTLRKEAIVVNKPNGRIAYRFHARDVHMIMSPGPARAPMRFRVFIDGQAPGSAHGVDVDADGNGTIREPRMYQLIRQQPPIADRLIEIEFLDAGAELFDFTFG